MNTGHVDPARYFDQLARQGYWHDFSENEHDILERILPVWDIHENERVLEPGCGTGRLTLRLAELVGPGGRVAACDISPEMLRIARSRKLPGHAAICQCSIHHLPFPDRFFDQVVCLNAFPHFVPLDPALSEIARVLCSEGRLHIAHLQSAKATNTFHSQGPHAIRTHLIPNPAELKNMLDCRGFELIHAEDSETGGFLASAVKRSL